MMIGGYPCCNGSLWLPMPDKTPAYLPEDCPHCGAKVWHRFSRVDPMSWLEADFLAEFDVDMEKKSVEPKLGSDAALRDAMVKAVGERAADILGAPATSIGDRAAAAGFHSGGLVGLRAGEVPAILSNETVIPRAAYERLKQNLTGDGHKVDDVTVNLSSEGWTVEFQKALTLSFDEWAAQFPAAGRSAVLARYREFRKDEL